MELIKVELNDKSEQIVSARDLHEFLGVKSKFADWIKNRIEKYDFIENVDYVTLSKNLENGGREIDYIIKLDMAKELSMVENNDKGKQARRYFIECEKRLKQISIKDNLYLGLFSKDPMVVANSHKELVRLEIKPLEDKIAQDKPLVEFANQVSSSSDSLLVREFCKVLADEKINIGQNKLYEWLRENGFVIKKKTEPTQKSMNMGLFECIERVVATPYGDKLSITTKITGKGQIYFTEKLREIYSK